jgi:DUF177 domain-containing protein
MSMLLDVSRLRGGAERVDRRFESSQFPREDEFGVAAPVVLDAEARKDGDNVRLVGRLTTALELACSRCLEPYTIPVDSAIDLRFLPERDDEPVAGDRELGVEDADVSFYRDEVIALGDVVRELCYLALPMKPLCREDCVGLCPVCGVNRNRDTCHCQPEWIDPRMEPLRHLREQ